uniref:Uncharacterized protein n=1 Tax=Rhizophagus irregularis (strain DAOM 181602 / DAOM 197198 / MUCL 43194) TaxID=747089 RepID=U9UTS9_RHIID
MALPIEVKTNPEQIIELTTETLLFGMNQDYGSCGKSGSRLLITQAKNQASISHQSVTNQVADW